MRSIIGGPGDNPLYHPAGVDAGCYGDSRGRGDRAGVKTRPERHLRPERARSFAEPLHLDNRLARAGCQVRCRLHQPDHPADRVGHRYLVCLPHARQHRRRLANNTVRETGGLFGVAILAAVFAHYGGYTSPAAFMHGFRYALLVAAAAALAGLMPAVLSLSKAQASIPDPGDPAPVP